MSCQISQIASIIISFKFPLVFFSIYNFVLFILLLEKKTENKKTDLTKFVSNSKFRTNVFIYERSKSFTKYFGKKIVAFKTNFGRI